MNAPRISPQEAARLVGQVEPAPLQRTVTIAADAGYGEPGERALAAPVTMSALFLRFDPTHELPHVVENEKGKPKARFECLGDLAIFVSRDHQTLPVRYLALVEREVTNRHERRTDTGTA